MGQYSEIVTKVRLGIDPSPILGAIICVHFILLVPPRWQDLTAKVCPVCLRTRPRPEVSTLWYFNEKKRGSKRLAGAHPLSPPGGALGLAARKAGAISPAASPAGNTAAPPSALLLTESGTWWLGPWRVSMDPKAGLTGYSLALLCF